MKPFLQLLSYLRESGIKEENLGPVVSGCFYVFLFFLSQLVTKNSLGAVQDALGRPDGKVTFDF